MLFGKVVLVSASAYGRCPPRRGCKYSNIIAYWPGPKNSVRVQEVSVSRGSTVFNKYTYPTNDITRCAESAIYILHIFAYNFGTR